MEITIIWILIFSGSAIGLLGIFLFASERELKRKRSQVDALTAQLNDPSALHGGSSTSNQPATDPSSELVAANAELSQRISDLTKQLQNNQDQIRRLQDNQAHLSSLEMEAAELRSSHQRLQQENLELKDQLLAADEYPHDSPATSDDVNDHSSWLEEDMRDLREKLETSEARVRELEMAQIASNEFSDDSFKEHQSYLEARISELEKELALDKEKLSDFDAMETRLKDFQRLYWESEDHNSRLREEMSRWQEHSTENEEHGQRLAVVRRHLDELTLKQACLAEQHRRLQEDTAAIGKLLDGAPQPPVQLELSDSVFQNVADPFEVDAAEYRRSDLISGESLAQQPNADPDESPPQPADDLTKIIPPQGSTSGAPDSSPQTNGRGSYKILVVMIPVLLVVGTVAAGFFRKHSPDPEVSAASASTPASVRAIEQPTAPVSATISNPGQGASSALINKHRATQISETDGGGKETQVNTVSTTSGVRDRRINEPIAVKLKSASSQPIEIANKPSPRPWGGYEVTRSTEVYSEPTENSQAIGKLDSGTQVNVVASRDGWLEIRSKNGRPPGFIKNDVAVRIGHN